MKLALLCAVAADKKSGRALTPLLPYNEAIADFKRRNASGIGHSPELPILEVWTGSGTVKSAKFDRFPLTAEDKKAAQKAKAAADAKAKEEAEAKAKADPDASGKTTE
jgi:hypothetical protein